ncbi:hypothetical protein [Glaciihabitans sp. dw_435]|uniref:hypothetical protein n=1 Tax=Glaciihabitans sp. dw_435 TaxID=2720081 RepID=UPI001BD46D07|nr:hypothetical protein [Glaciihabitans sp. dw_435]
MRRTALGLLASAVLAAVLLGGGALVYASLLPGKEPAGVVDISAVVSTAVPSASPTLPPVGVPTPTSTSGPQPVTPAAPVTVDDTPHAEDHGGGSGSGKGNSNPSTSTPSPESGKGKGGGHGSDDDSSDD